MVVSGSAFLASGAVVSGVTAGVAAGADGVSVVDLVASAFGASFVPASATMNVDGAMLQFGVTTPGPYAATDGYHPDDDVTGLMIRSLHEKGTSGGQPIATTKGYLVGRRNVYSVSGNTITGMPR